MELTEHLLTKKRLLEILKDKEIARIEEKYKDSINSIKDLIGDADEPSKLFYLQIRLYGYLLENDPDKTISDIGVKIRRAIHPPIAKSCPKVLMNPQVVENRKFLLSEETDPSKVEEDDPVVLPDNPVIWIQNHGFKDDVLSSISTIPRHTYILFGSLPQYFNTIYGFSAYIGGVVMLNRKNKNSRKASIPKAVELLNSGPDLLMCPEATWNKTPNLLQLEYWNGFYKIAKEAGVQVVPIVHYLKDPFERTNPIHTVIDDPIDISQYSEEEAIQIVRDKLATWRYLMMEKYGQTTREELIGDKTFDEAWNLYLQQLMGEVDFYDSEIEKTCDYRSKKSIRPEDVFASIASLENPTKDNILHVEYARNLVRERKKSDYQRMY